MGRNSKYNSIFYNVSIPAIVSRLGIKGCIDSVGNYYSNLINKNKATKRQIEEIFANVQSVDTKIYGKTLTVYKYRKPVG